MFFQTREKKRGELFAAQKLLSLLTYKCAPCSVSQTSLSKLRADYTGRMGRQEKIHIGTTSAMNSVQREAQKEAGITCPLSTERYCLWVLNAKNG